MTAQHEDLSQAFTDAIDHSARNARRFWAFTALWVFGATILLWVLNDWSSQLTALKQDLQDVEEETQQLVSAASEAKLQVVRLEQDLRETQRLAEKDLENTRQALKEEQGRFQELAEQQHAAQAQSRADLARVTREYQTEIQLLRKEAALARTHYDATVAKFEQLDLQFRQLDSQFQQAAKALKAQLEEAERQVGAMRNRVDNVERQLLNTHFVLQTRSRNEVYGMDIFIGFGAWKRRANGLNNLCVSLTKRGDCLWSQDFVKLGEQIQLDHGGFRFTITPRYAVGILLAHDHIGFDIMRERHASD